MGFHLAFSLVALAVVEVLGSLVEVVSKSRSKGKVGEQCSFGFCEWLGSGFGVVVGEGGRSDQCAVLGGEGSFVGVVCFCLGDLSLSGG